MVDPRERRHESIARHLHPRPEPSLVCSFIFILGSRCQETPLPACCTRYCERHHRVICRRAEE